MKKIALTIITMSTLCISLLSQAYTHKLHDSNDNGITNDSAITWTNKETNAGCVGVSFPKQIIHNKTFEDNQIQIDQSKFKIGDVCTATYIYSDTHDIGENYSLDLSVASKSDGLKFSIDQSIGPLAKLYFTTTEYGFHFAPTYQSIGKKL